MLKPPFWSLLSERYISQTFYIQGRTFEKGIFNIDCQLYSNWIIWSEPELFVRHRMTTKPRQLSHWIFVFLLFWNLQNCYLNQINRNVQYLRQLKGMKLVHPTQNVSGEEAFVSDGAIANKGEQRRRRRVGKSWNGVNDWSSPISLIGFNMACNHQWSVAEWMWLAPQHVVKKKKEER